MVDAGGAADEADRTKMGSGVSIVSRGVVVVLGLAAVGGAVVAFNVMKRK